MPIGTNLNKKIIVEINALPKKVHKVPFFKWKAILFGGVVKFPDD